MRRAALLTIFLGISIQAATPPLLKDAVGAKEFSCSGTALGLTTEAGKSDLKAFPLCVVDVLCRAKWDIEGYAKNEGFVQAVVCKPKDSGECPDMNDCVKFGNADGRDFDWRQVAAVSSTATKKNGDGLSCKYTGYQTDKVGLILREIQQPKGGVVLDGICASRVDCKPEEKTPVAVCRPRKSGTEPTDFVCPQAVDCVAEKFPLQKPKVEAASSQTHGGKPGTAHAPVVEQKR